MYCKQCGTENPDDAVFCKSCGASLAKEGRGPVPRGIRIGTTPFSWWFPLGVLAILAAVLLPIDYLIGARLLIFGVGTLSAALLVGLIYLLLFAAVEGYRKTIVLVLSVVLIAAPVVALPFMIQNLLRGWTQVGEQVTYSLPTDAAVETLALTVQNPLGRVALTAVDTEEFLAFAWVNLTGWGDQQRAIDEIRWTTEVVGSSATASLVLPATAAVFPWGGIGYGVDVHVSEAAGLSITVSSTTGTIAADLGPGTMVGVIRLETTTGTVELNLDGPTLFTYSSFHLQTTTGNVETTMTISDGPSAVIPVLAQTTTGTVDVTLNLGATVGARGSASATTGSVNIEETKYQGTGASFQTPNVTEAVTVLELTLATTTGSVDVG